VPLPAGRGADRAHDALAQDLRQRPAKPLEQAECQQVDAHVVVLEMATRWLQLAPLPLTTVVGADADLAMVIDLVGLAPQLALPFAGLLQQVTPANGLIVGACEPGSIDAGADRLIHRRDQPVGNGEPREHRQIALGDAERHVLTPGVAPLCNNAAGLENEAGGAAARGNGSRHLAPGPSLIPFDDADIATIVVVEARRPGAVAGPGKVDRRPQLASIEAGF